MLKLKSVSIRNWGWIRQTELEFPTHGLVLVLGNNTVDTHGKLESVGSGKTLIGEALSRALVGVNGRFTNLGWFANERHGSKDLLVQVKAELNGEPLSVDLGYKCAELSRTGEGFRFQHGTRDVVQRSHVDLTKAELYRALRITPELAEWSVFVDGDKLAFQRLSEKSAVELLMTALEQPPWTCYQEHALKVAGTFKTEVSQARASHDEARRAVAESDSAIQEAQETVRRCTAEFEAAEAALAETVAADTQRLAQLSSTMRELEESKLSIKRQIRSLEDACAVEYAKLDAALNKCTAALAAASRERETALEAKVEARSKSRAARNELTKLETAPAECPTCLRPLDKISQTALDAARDHAQRADDAYRAAERAFDVLDQKCRDADEAKTKAREKLDRQNVKGKVKKLSADYDDAELELSRLDQRHQRLSLALSQQRGPDRRDLTAAEAVLAERQGAAERARSRVATSASVLAEAEAALKVVQYWAEAFGPTGIPNMILRRTLDPLNSVSRRLAAALTGGTVGVSYDTTRELASGKDRAELVIKVANQLGSKRPEGGSKGESGLVNLIVAETLAEVGRVSSRVGYVWYDEVVKSQDATVRGNIYSYLKQKANEKGILIFVVDHHKESVNWADHVLLVEKNAAGTTARWVT